MSSPDGPPPPAADPLASGSWRCSAAPPGSPSSSSPRSRATCRTRTWSSRPRADRARATPERDRTAPPTTSSPGPLRLRDRSAPASSPLEERCARRTSVSWAVRGAILLEFPPVVGRAPLFLLKNNGALYAINKRTGKVRWKRKLGYLAASSPAYSNGTRLRDGPRALRGDGAGRVVALSTPRTARTLWSRKLPSRTESSPVVRRGTVYFGTEDGTVYALARRTARCSGRYQAGGAVKGGLALDRRAALLRRLRGRVHAIRATSGRRIWTTGTLGARFGLASGRFYATPGGRLRPRLHRQHRRQRLLVLREQRQARLAQEDRRVRLLLGRGRAVRRQADGLRRLLRRQASTRSTRDRARALGHGAGGRISGGRDGRRRPRLLPDLETRTTTALGARTGRKVFEFAAGGFNPVISDGREPLPRRLRVDLALRPRSGRTRYPRPPDGA